MTINKEQKNTAELEAKVCIERWINILESRDANKLADCYTNDASLSGTFSGKLHRSKNEKGENEILEYFKYFLKTGPKAKITEQIIEPLGANFILHTGIYEFKIDGDYKKAKFTFIYSKMAQNIWKIKHHNSGVLIDHFDKQSKTIS